MEENKYFEYINYPSDDEKRKSSRRKNRIRERVTAFVLLFVILAILGVGVWFGVRYFFSGKETKTLVVSTETSTEVSTEVSADLQEEMQQVIQNLIGNETEIVVDPSNEIVKEPTQDELFDEFLTSKISEYSLEEKVLALMIVRPEQITGVDTVIKAGDGTKTALEKYPVGGLLYTEKNVTDEKQFSEMLANTASFVKRPTFFAVKEQCGNALIGNKLKLDVPKSAYNVGETMDPYNAYTANQKLSEYLGGFGINMVLGPVADVRTENEEQSASLVWQECMYGKDPVVVSRMVLESVHAFEEKNIATTLMYFPSEGNLYDNPANTITNTQLTLEEAESSIKDIYKTGIDAGADAILVSHAYAENLSTDNIPCSLSKDIYTKILREDCGFTNTILISDELDAPTISEYFTSAESAVKAFKAGADMILCPENLDEAVTAVCEAVNSNVISEERINDSLKRVLRVKLKSEFEAQQSTETSDTETLDTENEDTETTEETTGEE